MPPLPPIVSVVFCAIVVVVTLVVLMAFRRAHLLLPGGLLVGVAYLAVPAVLAHQGVLDRYTPLPAPALVLLLTLTVLTVGTMHSRWGSRLADALPLGAVVLAQAFRIPVEWSLHEMYLDGALPLQMTYTGRNFDILSGLSGLLLGAWLLTGRPVSRSLVLGWNVVSLSLLANIVVVAILSTPVPFNAFPGTPPNLLPSTFPYVWLPSFLVQVALASHLLVFKQVRHIASQES